MVIALLAMWALTFMTTLQMFAQDTLPVFFRVATKPWCHHLKLANLFLWALCTLGFVAVRMEGKCQR
jgi:hypothetical protein